MSKAEDLAEKAYPEGDTYIFGDASIACQVAYVKGYHQAEKDMELTWKDMECIIKHYQDIMAEKSRVFVRVEDYQELLKRFKSNERWKQKMTSAVYAASRR